MWIYWILLNILAKKSDRDKVERISMSGNKTESYIQILYFISKAPGRRITESKLCELLGDPPRSTRYRLIAELLNGIGQIPPILIQENEASSEEKIFKLNCEAWDSFVYAGDEGHFFIEAFKKLGAVLNCDYTQMAFNDIFQERNKRIHNLDRKFIYLNKIETRPTVKFTQHIDAIVEALISNKKIKITYRPSNQQFNFDRLIEPLTLCQYRDDLYILCHKIEGNQKLQRNYKVSRIQELQVLNETFSYPSKEKWNPEKVFQDSSGLITGDEELATFRVYGHSRTVFREKIFFNAILIYQTELYDQYQAKYTNADEFLGQLFVYAQDIEILASSKLKEQFKDKAFLAISRNSSDILNKYQA